MTPGFFDITVFFSMAVGAIAFSGWVFGSSIIKTLLIPPWQADYAGHTKSASAVGLLWTVAGGIIGLTALALAISTAKEDITPFWLSAVSIAATAFIFLGMAALAAEKTREKLVQEISDYYVQRHVDRMEQRAANQSATEPAPSST